MRYILAILAVAGMVVSYLALRVHYDTGSAPCSINEKWDCGIVNHSPYAVIHGVPVAAHRNCRVFRHRAASRCDAVEDCADSSHADRHGFRAVPQQH